MGKLRDFLERSPSIKSLRSMSNRHRSSSESPPTFIFTMDSPEPGSSATPPVEFQPIEMVPERCKGKPNQRLVGSDFKSESGVGLGIYLTAEGGDLELPRRSFAIERPAIPLGPQGVNERRSMSVGRTKAVNKLML
ncbi:UNVERIFIED_CONTAM: hypothetical protein HDU68_011909 [Siphonaria sp. JEL0065]|nr:hypothetical protein HDU68_011909 [Siphonaria sp. JEL0065]